MADPKKDIKDVNEELGRVEDTLLSIANSLSSTIKRAIEDIKDDSKNVAEIFEKNLQKSIKDIAKNSDAIVSNQFKILSGAAKVSDIEKQILSNNTKRLAIERTVENLKKAGIKLDNKTLELHQNALEAIENQNKVLQEQKKEVKEIQKKLGATGDVLKGISKIPILGNLIDAEEALAAAQLEASKNTSTSTSTMRAAFSSLGKSIKSNLSDPIFKFGLAVKFLSLIPKLFSSIDEEAGKTAKSIGMSYNNALLLNEELRDTVIDAKILGVNFTEIAEAQRLLSERFGTFNKISDNVLVTQSQLTKLIGLSADESTKILQASTVRGINEDKFVKQVYASNVLLNAQNKTFLSEKVVLKDIAATSNVIKLSIKGGTDQLVKSVHEARKLGVSLNQLDQIAGSLLNFEESISAELEAELITGKDLNLERARLYAINNDIEGLTREITAQGITSEKFSRMNRLQQEAIAKSVGMTRDSMADMFTEQKSLDELQKNASYRDVKSLKDAEERFKARAKEVGTAKALEELGETEFAQKQKTLSAQESFNEAMIRLGDIVKKVVDGPMGKMLSLITTAIDKILKIPGLDKIVGVVGLAGTVASIVTIGRSIIGRPSGRYSDPIYTANSSDGGTSGGGTTGGRTTSGGLGNLLKKGRAGKVARGRAIKSLSRKIPYAGAAIGLTNELMEGGFNLESLGRATLSGGGAFIGGLAGGIAGLGAASIPVGIAGGIAGGMAGDKLGDLIFGEREEMARGGIVSKPTRALVGEAGAEAVIPLDKFYSKLDELIDAVKAGGNVYIDGNKAGTAFNIGTYRTQ